MEPWGEDSSEDEEGDADERNPSERDDSSWDFVLHRRGELDRGEREREWDSERLQIYREERYIIEERFKVMKFHVKWENGIRKFPNL